MKTYGELSIDLHGISPEEFGDVAESSASAGWARDRTKDEELKRTGGGAWFTFTLSGHNILPSAFLFVTPKKPGGVLYVSNIISPARDRLNYDEYNQILQSFADSVLVSLRNQKLIDFSLRGTDIDLSALLPHDVFEKLRRFSALANKKTGSSHPLDQERWMDFLIASNESGVELDSNTLARWLVEVEGWEGEQASHLAEEYQFGRGLLQRAS